MSADLAFPVETGNLTIVRLLIPCKNTPPPPRTVTGIYAKPFGSQRLVLDRDSGPAVRCQDAEDDATEVVNKLTSTMFLSLFSLAVMKQSLEEKSTS